MIQVLKKDWNRIFGVIRYVRTDSNSGPDIEDKVNRLICKHQ